VTLSLQWLDVQQKLAILRTDAQAAAVAEAVAAADTDAPAVAAATTTANTKHTEVNPLEFGAACDGE
jgi:hypothetical protein